MAAAFAARAARTLQAFDRDTFTLFFALASSAVQSQPTTERPNPTEGRQPRASLIKLMGELKLTVNKV